MEEAAEASSCVGIEQLLLGLLREERGVGALVLAECGVTLRSARRVFRDTSASGRSATFRVELDDASEQSIYEQIVGQIQEGIATAKLLPGERLPTVRQMADDLDVAPGTVARAYGELERVGAVETDGVRGTRVAQQQGPSLSAAARGTTLVSLLRPVAVAAFHLGASAADVRRALDHAMKGIFEQDNAA